MAPSQCVLIARNRFIFWPKCGEASIAAVNVSSTPLGVCKQLNQRTSDVRGVKARDLHRSRYRPKRDANKVGFGVGGAREPVGVRDPRRDFSDVDLTHRNPGVHRRVLFPPDRKCMVHRERQSKADSCFALGVLGNVQSAGAACCTTTLQQGQSLGPRRGGNVDVEGVVRNHGAAPAGRLSGERIVRHRLALRLSGRRRCDQEIPSGLGLVFSAWSAGATANPEAARGEGPERCRDGPRRLARRLPVGAHAKPASAWSRRQGSVAPPGSERRLRSLLSPGMDDVESASCAPA